MQHTLNHRKRQIPLKDTVTGTRSLLSLAGAATNIIFVATKMCLSQEYACRDKIIAYICRSLARQAYLRQ